jgi:hypothetical protein
VLTLLGFTPRADYAGQQRGACPLHGSTHGTARCFSVNTNTHTFHASCLMSWNGLEPSDCESGRAFLLLSPLGGEWV